MTAPDDKSPSSEEYSPVETPTPVRRWPAVVILALAVLALTLIWTSPNIQRQFKHIDTFIVVVVTSFLVLIWFALFSRIALRLRLLGTFLTISLVVTSVAVFKSRYQIRGFTGDFIPIIERRDKPRDSERIAASQSLPATPAQVDVGSIQSTTNDFPQFMGPMRDCIVTGPRLEVDWVTHPPKELWRHPVGPAWSGFAVVGNVAVTQEQRADNEMVIAYELHTGAGLWSHSDSTHYVTPIAGEGPRATPTIADGRVFTHGATGRLNCLELATGKLIWSVDVLKENQTQVPQWGVASSPLVVSNLVVVCAGGKSGTLAAFNRESGELAWNGGTDSPSYSSPILVELAGRKQILSFNDASISAHDPVTGEVLWSHPWNARQPKVALPVVLPGDRVYFSSGYGVGSQLFEVSKGGNGSLAVRQIWQTLKMKAKFTNLIYRDGFIYGVDDGIMACQEVATGEMKWKDGRYGHGQAMLTGDLMVVMCETGDVVLMKPASDQLHELGRFTAFTDKTWNPPALVGDLLLVRNHKEAACYRLTLAK